MRPHWAWYVMVLAVAYRMTEAALAALARRGRAASQTRALGYRPLRASASPSTRPARRTAVQATPTGPPRILRPPHLRGIGAFR